MFLSFELQECQLSNEYFEIALNFWMCLRDLEASSDLTSTQRIPQLVSSRLLPPATVTDAKAPCCPGSFSGPSAQLALPLWAELWQSVWRAPAMLSLPSSWQAGFTRSSWHGPGVEVGFPPFSMSATWILLAVDSQRHKSDGWQCTILSIGLDMFVNRNSETLIFPILIVLQLKMFENVCVTWYDHDMNFTFSWHEESSTLLVAWLDLLAPSCWDPVRVALRILKSLNATIFHWSSLAPSPCGSAGTASILAAPWRCTIALQALWPPRLLWIPHCLLQQAASRSSSSGISSPRNTTWVVCATAFLEAWCLSQLAVETWNVAVPLQLAWWAVLCTRPLFVAESSNVNAGCVATSRSSLFLSKTIVCIFSWFIGSTESTDVC